MTGDRLGSIFRAVRIRLGLRQVDAAKRAGVSDGGVSRIERGRLDDVSFSTLQKIADALEIRLEIVARRRGGELDRMINSKHAALAEDVIAWIGEQTGWDVRPEVSFSIYRERGIIDLHAEPHAELVPRPDAELDDAAVARELAAAGRAYGTTGRTFAVAGRASGGTSQAFGAAGRTTPGSSRSLEVLAALAFVPFRRQATVRQVPATNRRVRVPRTSPDAPG